MKCKDFEQDIYLYSELTEAERIRVDKHLQECAACNELFQLVASVNTSVAQVLASKPEPPHHARLTSNIMQAVAAQQKQSASWFNNLFLRYAMVAASFILVIAFGTELSLPDEGLSKRVPEAKTVTLNSASFLKAAIDRKQNPEVKFSLYACVKSGDCDNTIFQSFKKKSF